jgi:hypothetical protein
MKTEQFSKYLLQSRIFDTYVGAVFFGTVIFFVLNASFYTPLEMIIGIIIVTVLFKGLANIMISMTIALLNLSNDQDRLDFEKSSNSLQSLVNDLAIQEAATQSNKTINNS